MTYKIDIHAHVLPKSWPDFNKQFGYDGFIYLEDDSDGSVRMMKNGKLFRKVEENTFSPAARISDCEKTGVNLQVLSTVPVMFHYWAKDKDALATSKFFNDDIAATCKEFPNKFVGLGTVPLQNPALSATELERCIKELGLRGIQIGSHVGATNLDDESFYPLYEAAEDLGAAIMVHPWDMMGTDTMKDYWLPWLVGMPAETTRAMCSMIFGAVFDRFPKLKVLFAHGGGAFAHTLGRIEHGFRVRPDLCQVKTKKSPREYLGRFYVDSITHDFEALKTSIKTFGAEKIALGSDYPFPLGEHHPGKMIEDSSLSKEVKAQLLYGTAFDWLGLSQDEYLN